jgi:hypothetical protein
VPTGRENKLLAWSNKLFSTGSKNAATSVRALRFAVVICRVSLNGIVATTRPCTIAATAHIAHLNRFLVVDKVNLDSDPR